MPDSKGVVVRLVQACFLLSVFTSTFTFADQVYSMSNGDHLTGTIVKSDDKSLILKTDYAGELTIDWKSVNGINSSQAMHVQLKSGETIVGPVSAKDDKFEVATQSNRSVDAAKENIVSIRSDAEDRSRARKIPSFRSARGVGWRNKHWIRANSGQQSNQKSGFSFHRRANDTTRQTEPLCRYGLCNQRCTRHDAKHHREYCSGRSPLRS